MSQTDALVAGLERLPAELILEVAQHLDIAVGERDTESDEPRSLVAEAFLLGLLGANRRLRAIAIPLFGREIRIRSKSSVSGWMNYRCL